MKIKELPENEDIVSLKVGDVIHAHSDYYYMIVKLGEKQYGLVCLETGKLQVLDPLGTNYFVEDPNEMLNDTKDFKVVTGDFKVTL